MKNSKIENKIDEIYLFLEELGSILPSDFEDYTSNIKDKAACERYFEKIIKAVVDLVFIVIKQRELQIPGNDRESFDILEREGIITKEISEKLSDAKGMRNILAHEYGKIDERIVFEAITTKLIPDVEEFLKQIKENV